MHSNQLVIVLIHLDFTINQNNCNYVIFKETHLSGTNSSQLFTSGSFLTWNYKNNYI